MSVRKQRLCLFGAGGHGRVVAAQVLRSEGRDVCFADSRLAPGTMVGGIQVNWSAIPDVRDCELIVTIGRNSTRAALQAEGEGMGLQLSTFIADPHNYFGSAPGAGSMVLAGAIVTLDAQIHKGVIVNSGAIVEHDVVIGDFCHLAPGSVIAGGATIGSQVFVGANATVLPGVSVAAGTTIGAGAVVNRDIVASGVYVGVPARRIEHQD